MLQFSRATSSSGMYRSRCAAYYDGGHFLPIVPGVFDSAVQGFHSRMGLVKTSCYAAAFGSLKNEGLDMPGDEPVANVVIHIHGRVDVSFAQETLSDRFQALRCRD